MVGLGAKARGYRIEGDSTVVYSATLPSGQVWWRIEGHENGHVVPVSKLTLCKVPPPVPAPDPSP